MHDAHWHRFQVLTERPERVENLDNKLGWSDNIWMGTSIESEDYLFRIDHLRNRSTSQQRHHHRLHLVHQVRGWFSGVELKMSRRQGAEEEAYRNRDVTDEQRSRRLIFSSTPWAVHNWRFWRVARSTGMIHIRALRSRLPKSPIPRRRR